MLSLADAQPTNKFEIVRGKLATRLVFIGSSSLAIKILLGLTHIFVAISTTASLGSLLYSGFHPGEEIGCGWMITLLAMPYISIFWTLTIYLVYIPFIGRVVRRAAK
jgi:hypothetical protein